MLQNGAAIYQLYALRTILYSFCHIMVNI